MKRERRGNSQSKWLIRTLSQHQTTSDDVVDGALAGRQASAETINQEIINPQEWHMDQQTTAKETLAGSPKANRITVCISQVQTKQPFSHGGAP